MIVALDGSRIANPLLARREGCAVTLGAVKNPRGSCPPNDSPNGGRESAPSFPRVRPLFRGQLPSPSAPCHDTTQFAAEVLQRPLVLESDPRVLFLVDYPTFTSQATYSDPRYRKGRTNRVADVSRAFRVGRREELYWVIPSRRRPRRETRTDSSIIATGLFP